MYKKEELKEFSTNELVKYVNGFYEIMLDNPSDSNLFEWDYYMRARYYSPSIGRFISEDTHWNPSNMIYGDKREIREIAD